MICDPDAAGDMIAAHDFERHIATLADDLCPGSRWVGTPHGTGMLQCGSCDYRAARDQADRLPNHRPLRETELPL